MQRGVVLAGLCGLVLSIMAGTANAAAFLPLFEQRAGAWVLTAYTRSDVGPFTHCTLRTRTTENVLLVFSIDRNQAAGVFVARSSWTLPAGRREPVAYQVDENDVLTGLAAALGGGIVIPLPGDTPLFDQLSAGEVLRLELGDEIREFGLAGISSLLPSLAECVQRFRDDVIEALAPPPQPTDAAETPTAMRNTAEAAARWARQITADGAMPRVRLLTSEEMAHSRWYGFFGNAAAGWHNDKVIGALEVHHPRALGLSDAADAWSEALLKTCDNDYIVRRKGRDDLVIGVHIDCMIKAQRVYRAAVVFRDKKGFFYLGSFHSIAGTPRDDTELAAEDLRRAALSLLAQ